MTEFYFVRHGESTANVDGVSAGWTDVPLTEKGMRQAQAAATQIRDAGLCFDMIISSPLSRALDTAKVIAGVNGFPEDNIVILPELKEKTSGTLELRPLRAIFNKTEEQMKELGGENAAMFRKRVEKALKIIREKGKGGKIVLVIAHSGIYKMAEVITKDFSPATRMYEIEIPENATLLRLSV